MKSLIKPLHALQKAYKQTGTSSLTNCESLPEFHELLSNLTKINLEDVGLNLSQVPNYFKNNTLTYMNILQASGVSIDLFCLPKGGSFKLHDHTNMLVITKILSGSVQCKAFDLVDRSFQERVQDPVVQDESDFADVRLEAVLHEDRVLESGEVTFLTPEKGNIHSIVALENVILVDFLLPGYSQGNLSTYYEEVAVSEIKTFGEETKGFSTNCVKSITSYNSNENNCGSDVETNQSSDEDENRRVNRKRVLKPISDPDEMRVWIFRNPDIEIKDFDKLD